MAGPESEHIYGVQLRESANDGSDFSNADADYRILFVGEDGLFHLKDSAGTVTTPGGGSVATDAIWDAAGDTVVGTGANTAARLAIGAAGGALSRVNGAVAWNSGTSFPTAATGDRYWRTDLGLEAYYDGTRWLTTTLYRETLGHSSSSAGAGTDAIQPIPVAGNSIARWTPWSTTYDLWLDAFYTSTFVNGTNNGTNFWTLALQKADAADAKTGIVSFTTAAHTASNWTQLRTSIAAVYTASAHRELDVQATPTLTPGSLFWAVAMSYRLILT